MSIAEEITSMGENLKKDYQSIANLGADLTNVDKNIENIAGLLDGVYDNLPKTEYGEGTEVNLGVTIKGKLDFENGVVGIGQSSQDGEPTPTNEVPIQCVTGNIEEVVSGKNLWAFTNGNFYMNSNTTTNIINVNKIEVTSSNTAYANAKFIVSEQGSDIELKDGTYTFSLGKVTNSNSNMTSQLMTLSTYTNGTREPISYISVGSPKTVSIANAPNKKYVLEFWGSYDTALINTATYENIQVEENNQATTYEPYITPTTYQLSLGDNKFYSIGDYADELIYDVENDKVYKKAYIDEKILTSSMCNGVTASASYGTLCYLNFNGMVDNNVVCAMSNKFVGVSYNDRTSLPTGYRIFTSDGAGGVTLRLPNTSDIDTLQEAKDFVDNNAITVYYVLATPTLIEITDTTLINQVKAWYNAHSLNGTTIITSNGNLPMIIKVRALKGE